MARPKKCFLCRLEGATRRPQSRVPFENGLGNRKIKFTECRQRDGNKNTFNSIGGECLLRQPLLAEMSAGGSKILREGLPTTFPPARPSVLRHAALRQQPNAALHEKLIKHCKAFCYTSTQHCPCQLQNHSNHNCHSILIATDTLTNLCPYHFNEQHNSQYSFAISLYPFPRANINGATSVDALK